MSRYDPLYEWKVEGSGAEAYEHYIVPAWMGEWADALIAVAQLEPGQQVLDVACGTGVVARRAAIRLGTGAKVSGLDADPGMIQVARRYAEKENAPFIDWHCGDAVRMPFSDERMDVLICQQGLQFFPDQPAALREMSRVLARGGRLALSVWRALDRSPFLAVLAEVLGRYLGPEATMPFHATCSLSRREDLRQLVSAAGFSEIHIRLEAKVARYPSFSSFLHGYISVFPFAARIAAMPEVDRIRMFEEIYTALETFIDDDGLAVPMESHLLTACKPV